MSPLNQRRWQLFKANRRAWWALWAFLLMFGISLVAELVANDKPLLVSYAGELYFPLVTDYPETTFGGDLPLAADFRDSYLLDLIIFRKK